MTAQTCYSAVPISQSMIKLAKQTSLPSKLGKGEKLESRGDLLAHLRVLDPLTPGASRKLRRELEAFLYSRRAHSLRLPGKDWKSSEKFETHIFSGSSRAQKPQLDTMNVVSPFLFSARKR